MRITFEGKKPKVDGIIKVGNLGEQNVDTIEFVFSKIYNDIDLSTYIPTIEWARLAGGADFASTTSTTVEGENIIITWLLDGFFLNTAGKASCRIYMKSETGENIWISDIVNMFISGGLNLSDEVAKSYPENYRELWDNVFQLREDVEAGMVKGDKGDKGDIFYPTFSVNDDMELEISNYDESSNLSFSLSDGYLILEVN